MTACQRLGASSTLGRIATGGVHHHVRLYPDGGAARVAAMLVAEQQRAGWPVTVSFETCSDRQAMAQAHCTHVCDAAAVVARVPAGGVLHLHTTQDWPSLLLAAAQRGLRPVVTLHDAALLTGGCVYPMHCMGWRDGCHDDCPQGYADAPAEQARRRAALALCRPLLASPSSWLAGLARQALEGGVVRVIPNGVEAAPALHKAEARSSFGLSASARVAVLMAHGGEQAAFKGGAHWAALADALAQRVPSCVVVLAGSIGQGGQAHLGGALGNVLRLPLLDRATVQALFAAADLYVHPALQDNHPLVVLEAMAAGLAVCGFAAGGVVEQVRATGRENDTGVLVPVGDWSGLADACATLLLRGGRRLGLAARQAWAEAFTTQRMASGYAALYAKDA